MIERISLELTNRCSKGCGFCYNASNAGGRTEWEADEAISFVSDCAAHGIRAVSFGGGEPLQFEGVWRVLEALRGVLFRSMTTNGLLLTEETIDRLRSARPEKVHVSIHYPDRDAEVRRVIAQVGGLHAAGIRCGINFLVRRSGLEAARTAAKLVRDSGIGNDRIVYLPMRGQDTPTPEEMARVAGGGRFQSVSCLATCAASPRFVSVGWDKRVGWCSYTAARRRLESATYRGLSEALEGLGLAFCGS